MTEAARERLTLRFWGVRGSVPVSGADKIGYGGHTTCLEVKLGDERFIIDAGSGILQLGRAMMAEELSGCPIHLLMSHLHHDHVLGLPFFKPLHRPGQEITLHSGHLGRGQCAEAIERMFSPPLFPVRIGDFAARIRIRDFTAGERLVIGNRSIGTLPLNHPSGATAYRFDNEGGSLAVVTDIEHGPSGPAPELVAFCQDANVLVYDMMFEEEEYCHCQGFGHSTASAAIELADAAHVGRLIGTHHAPHHDDAMLAFREAKLQAARPGSLLAREGAIIDCSSAGA